jgi:DNA-binding FadR family transcriptional regulator
VHINPIHLQFIVEDKMQRNLTQQLVPDLGVAIVQGKYRVRGSVPSEADICKQYGVSRSATREAVKMLAAKGLLTSRPRQGIRVLPEDSWNMFDSDVLQWLLQSRPSRELLAEFAEMRHGIEPEAAALAARSATPEAVRGIEVAYKRMEAAEMGFDDELDSDIAFHVAILNASGNRFYRQMSAFVETALRVSIRFTNATKGVKGPDVAAHGEILKAIQKKNPQLARKKTQALLAESLELIRRGAT